MKRCPKCGTVLDDDKKKCYMCGADLLKSSITQFGDSFDTQIGATVSNSQDNVFNSVDNIGANLSDAVGKNENDNSTFTNSGADFYNNSNGLDGLNSMQYDNRTALEKIFSGNQRFKSKDEINAELSIMKNNKPEVVTSNKEIKPSNFNNNNISNNIDTNGFEVPPTMNNKPDLMPGFEGFNNTSKPNNINNSGPMSASTPNEQGSYFKPPEDNIAKSEEIGKKKKEKLKINWGDNLEADEEKKGFSFNLKGIKLDIGLVVNTACFIVFIIGVVFVYFKFLKPDDEDNNFGGLVYRINEKLILKTEDSNSRYYNYGDNCAIQVRYGTATGENSFIGNYFDGVREKYANDDRYITQESTLGINGNNWSSLEVLQIEQSDAAIGGTQTMIKYKYVSMIYKNNYYQITYANTDNNTECSAMYNDMLNSMEFKQ